MKTAVLIHGQPRFGRCTTELFAKFIDHDAVDWFLYLWEETSPDPRGWNLVAPCWEKISHEFTVDQFQRRLPAGHRIAKCIVSPLDIVTIPEFHRKPDETSGVGSYLQFWTMHQCDLLRRERESISGTYDAVIKLRPDTRLAPDLSAERILEQITAQPDNTVWTSHLGRFGYSGQINDQFALGSSKAMSEYCDLAVYIQEYQDAGVQFHPETLLAHHVSQRNLVDICSEYTVELRPYVQHRDSGLTEDFGDWDTILE
jgi:hypothetical protein